MLCAKCHKTEATVHLTTIVGEEKVERIDLCPQCAPAVTGYGDLNPEKLKALSPVGKKCEFCAKEAVSGQMEQKGGAIYWCFDCGAEFGRIVTESVMAERPDLFQQAKEPGWSAAIFTNQEIQDWLQALNERAVKMLKERMDRERSGTG